MTKDLLEQYPDICRELEELQKQDLFPDRQNALQVQKSEIERFVNSLPTSRQRRVVMLRVFQKLKWPEVVAKMGYKYSKDQVKRTYYDIMKFFL